MIIYKALLVYGYENFILEISEHCDPSLVLERKQYYIDLLEPKYNILKVAVQILAINTQKRNY